MRVRFVVASAGDNGEAREAKNLEASGTMSSSAYGSPGRRGQRRAIPCKVSPAPAPVTSVESRTWGYMFRFTGMSSGLCVVN
jgi:hypothetical protein